MNGITTTGWVKFAALVMLLLGNLQPLHAGSDQITIVKSKNNSYFNETIENLISNVEDAVTFNVLEAESIDANNKLLSQSNRIISLGLKATQIISERFPEKYLIAAYLTQQQQSRAKFSNDNHLTVLLDQPLERYLAFTRFLLNLKSVGIINSSPLEPTLQQQKILERLMLDLNQYQFEESRKLLGTVRQLVKQNEALLMLPEQNIYNRNTLKGVLLTAYRARIPVISYSPAHVKSGALASIYSSPADIGRHLADILNTSRKISPDKQGTTQFARYYSVAINSRVAHALGLELPEEDELEKYLSEIIQ